MFDINSLLPYYPMPVADNAAYHKHILKEYVELVAQHLHFTGRQSAKILYFGVLL